MRRASGHGENQVGRLPGYGFNSTAGGNTEVSRLAYETRLFTQRRRDDMVTILMAALGALILLSTAAVVGAYMVSINTDKMMLKMIQEEAAVEESARSAFFAVPRGELGSA